MMKAYVILVLAAGLVLSAAAVADDARIVRIQFDSGTSSAVVTDRIAGHEYVLYKLRAREGQFLTVSLRPDNQSADFNIYIPGRGPGDEALYSSATGGDRKYHGQLYAGGDHTVSVFLNRNAARQEQVANFDIEFELSPLETTGSAVNPAESACLAAVAKQVGGGDVSTISVKQGENATNVLVRVPGAQKPWHCDYGYTDKGPGVLQVFYTGEG